MAAALKRSDSYTKQGQASIPSRLSHKSRLNTCRGALFNRIFPIEDWFLNFLTMLEKSEDILTDWNNLLDITWSHTTCRPAVQLRGYLSEKAPPRGYGPYHWPQQAQLVLLSKRGQLTEERCLIIIKEWKTKQRLIIDKHNPAHQK